MPEVFDAGLVLEPRAKPRGAGLELRNRLRGRVDGRAQGIVTEAVTNSFWMVREETEAGPATQRDARGQNQTGESDRAGDVAPAESGIRDRFLALPNDVPEPSGEAPLEPAPPAGPSRAGMRQIGGQDGERLDQREEQAGDDHQRHEPEDLPEYARCEHQARIAAAVVRTV